MHPSDITIPSKLAQNPLTKNPSNLLFTSHFCHPPQMIFRVICTFFVALCSERKQPARLFQLPTSLLLPFGVYKNNVHIYTGLIRGKCNMGKKETFPRCEIPVGVLFQQLPTYTGHQMDERVIQTASLKRGWSIRHVSGIIFLMKFIYTNFTKFPAKFCTNFTKFPTISYELNTNFPKSHTNLPQNLQNSL